MTEHLNLKSIGLSIMVILAARGLITMIDLQPTISPHENVGFTIKEGIGVQAISAFEAAESYCQSQQKYAIRVNEFLDSRLRSGQWMSFRVHHFVCAEASFE